MLIANICIHDFNFLAVLGKYGYKWGLTINIFFNLYYLFYYIYLKVYSLGMLQFLGEDTCLVSKCNVLAENYLFKTKD